MEELEERTQLLLGSAQTVWDQVVALAIAWSFSVLGAIVLLIVGYILAGVLGRSVYTGLGRFRGFDETLRRFFSRTARYAALVLVGVTVLAQFGVQTASIIAALGAIGLAVGLALQGTLQNIAAGIMLLVLRPFRVGEAIDAGTVSGTVEEIGLFATELKTFDGVFVMAPNSQLWNSPVKNYTRNPVRMGEIAMGIGYKDDIDLALKTLMGLIASDPRILDNPAPTAFVEELTPTAISVKARYWTAGSDWWATKLDMTKAGKEAFDRAGLSIPVATRELHNVDTEPKSDADKAQ